MSGSLYKKLDQAAFRALRARQFPYLSSWVQTPAPDGPAGNGYKPSTPIIWWGPDRGAYQSGRYFFDTPVRTGYRVNDKAQGMVFQPGSKSPKGTVLVLQGWMARSQKLPWTIGMFFALMGYRCFLPMGSFHMRRRVHNTFDGQLLFGPDAKLARLTMDQAVAEARHLIEHARRQCNGPVILVGGSLGAIVSSHLLQEEKRIDKALLFVAGGNLLQCIEKAELFGPMWKTLSSNSSGLEACKQSLYELDPARQKPLINSDKIEIHGGRYDGIFGPEAIEKLGKTWDVPYHIHDCGHATIYTRALPIFRKLDRSLSPSG